MKKLHLLCNSHIDLAWMWDQDEGLATGLSTFYSASSLLKEYDYVFCHNEVLIYEAIKECDPPLYAQIKEQIKAGQWKVVGGFYLQPDCDLPSGEAMVRQIMIGRNFLAKEFGIAPKSTWNVDSFGHCRGLVQILKKTGYDGYIFCRPMADLMPLPSHAFLWKGLDGSTIKACRPHDTELYTTRYGHAKEDILAKEKGMDQEDVGLVLWGVGNHGGGASRKDLGDIAALQKEVPYQIIHSDPDAYFADIDPKDVYASDLYPIFVKAYSSMNRIKQKNIELEHSLFFSEKIALAAHLAKGMAYDSLVFDHAMKALAKLEFHDVLAGTACPEAEKSFSGEADGAISELSLVQEKALFALASNEKPAAKNTYPVFVFNPHPYSLQMPLFTEILVMDSLVSETEHYQVVAKEDGKIIPLQVIKEHTNINYDRRKRLVYEATLKPFGLSRIDMEVSVVTNQVKKKTSSFVFEGEGYEAAIDPKSGLLCSYKAGGKERLSAPAFLPLTFEDNADPWGWGISVLGEKLEPFVLSEGKRGPFEGIAPIQITEEGEVLAKVEACFEKDSSFVKVSYRFYHHHPYIDVILDVYWNEKLKGLKVAVPSLLKDALIGQTMFGYESYPQDGLERPLQRFIAAQGKEDKVLALFNNCVYGHSAKEGVLYETLLNGSAYAAHPIENRPLMEMARQLPFIEDGCHAFHFRLDFVKPSQLEEKALCFVEKPYSLPFFPHGKGEPVVLSVSLDNPQITLQAAKKGVDGSAIFRLLNGDISSAHTVLAVQGERIALSFGPFEVKTIVYNGARLCETEDLRI